ncbi:30141_t:CDS:2, partial [Racocetra persica]
LSSTASRDAINNHYAMLTSCFAKSISDDVTIQSNHPSIIKNISFGSFNCYIGMFNPSDAVKLARLPEVENVESDKTIRIVSKRTKPPSNRTTTTPLNLDRIDQQRRPLDGKYTYPSSAGSNVNVYIVDGGVNVKNKEFGGRAKLGPALCKGCSNDDILG